ncbi:MAG: (d)CMP kinase [Deltaproteobacteria bacterium]|nr:(d)CMP kinase [Deltaproteobacteria bacterium]
MLIITLDGPGGSGKSTIAQALAKKMGYYFLSTGLIYRTLAWHLSGLGWDGVSPVDPVWLNGFHMKVDSQGRVHVNGKVVEVHLHEDAISRLASVVSTQPLVRERSNRIQREIAQGIEQDNSFSGMVIEGRDSGTVVFPQAGAKFFITASPEERARRRFEDLVRLDPSTRFEAVLEGLRERDKRDAEREIAPLKPAVDAIVVDTSTLSFEEVLKDIAGRLARLSRQAP